MDESMASAPHCDAQLFQSRSTKPIAICVGIMFAFFFIPGLQFFGRSSIHGSNPLAGAITTACGLVGILWCVVYIRRSGVKVTQQNVTIANWIRKYGLSWEDLWGFRFGNQLPSDFGLEQMMFTPSLTPYAILNSGRRIPMVGLTAVRIRGTASRASVQIMLDELERLRVMACSDGRAQ
jgi:hypothetical protein